MAVGCNVEKMGVEDTEPSAPLPIEFYFTLSDESGRNLLDQSGEDAIPVEEISVVYDDKTYRPEDDGDGLTLKLNLDSDGVIESLYFGQIDGTLNIEAAPVTLVAGENTFTVMLSNSYDPHRDPTAHRHYYWHNQDWYGKDVIPFVVEEEKEFVPPENLIDID